MAKSVVLLSGHQRRVQTRAQPEGSLDKVIFLPKQAPQSWILGLAISKQVVTVCGSLLAAVVTGHEFVP